MPGVGAHFFFFFFWYNCIFSEFLCAVGKRIPSSVPLLFVPGSELSSAWLEIYIYIFFFKESRVFLSVTGIYSCIKLSFFLEEESIRSLALLRHDYNAETISRGHGMLAFLNFNFLFRKFSYRPIPSGKKC